MRTRTRYGLLLLLLTALMMALAAEVRCQDPSRDHLPDHPTHETEGDFWDSLRILKVSVLNFNPASGVIDAKFEDTRKVDVLQFQLTRSTILKAEIKGEILIIYCAGRHGEGMNDRIRYLLQIEKSSN